MREVVKEIADFWIVAVAQYGLIFEMLSVMPQLLLDVRKLRVKLILLRRLRGVHASIQRLARHLRDNHAIPFLYLDSELEAKLLLRHLQLVSTAA